MRVVWPWVLLGPRPHFVSEAFSAACSWELINSSNTQVSSSALDGRYYNEQERQGLSRSLL